MRRLRRSSEADLTSAHNRRQLVQLAEHVERQTEAYSRLRVPGVDPQALDDTLGVVRLLKRRLGTAESLSPRGALGLRALLTSPVGPFDAPDRIPRLAGELRDALAALEPA